MADYQIYNDRVTNVPIKCFNPSTGTTEVFPTGTIFTVASSNPNSLSAVMTVLNNLNQIILTPKVQESTGIAISVGGTAMVGASFLVDIVSDPDQLQILIDTASTDVTWTPQNIPTAPGP